MEKMTLTRTSFWLGLGIALLAGGCGDGEQPPPSMASRLPTTASTPKPTTPSTGTTTTTATTAPTTTTSPASNRPPIVRVTGDDGCHPRQTPDAVDPCAVSFRAEASDPDGDSLTYRWSGCASGSATTATCSIDSLAAVTATVEVTDERGGRARASKSAKGTNRPPIPGHFFCHYRPIQNPGAPDCGSQACSPPLPTNGIGFCIDGDFDARDTEGDLVTCGPVESSGPCGRPIVYECGGVGKAFSFEFHTGAEEGDCVFTVEMSDVWGAVAKTTVRVPVRPLP